MHHAQTLSSFGITGLYITFVFGIGRFLRLSTQNRRMHIPYEDLPTATRLAALCQARLLPLRVALLSCHTTRIKPELKTMLYMFCWVQVVHDMPC